MKQDPQTQIIEKLDSLHAKVDGIEEAMVTKTQFSGLSERVGNLETKVDNMVTRDEFHTAMDEVLVIVRRLDQERLFTTEWIRRIESDVERVKKHLHLA